MGKVLKEKLEEIQEEYNECIYEFIINLQIKKKKLS